MLTKTCTAEVKAVGDGEDGIFEAIVSVFGNKDSYGDVILKGAFAETLNEWAEKGDPIPSYWSHRMDDPDYNIGHVLEAKETDKGLWVKVQLDLDEDAKKARQVYRLLKGRRVTQFSFAYDLVEWGFAESEELGQYMELRKLKLYEVGPTPIGANQDTELLTVKHAAAAAEHLTAGLKAGRAISAKNETELRSAHESLGKVLAALEPEDQEKASGNRDAKDEEPEGAKSEEQNDSPSAQSWESETKAFELELELLA